jgi:valyl-tRNA synthetase
MLAPVLPHATEALWRAGRFGAGSIHRSSWPAAEPSWRDPAALPVGEALVAVAEAARRWKTERRRSVAAPLERIEVRCRPDLVAALREAEPDLRSVTRAGTIEVRAGGEGVEVAVRD